MSDTGNWRHYLDRVRIWLCALALIGAMVPLPAQAAPGESAGTHQVLLPILWLNGPGDVCAPIPGESYGTLTIEGPPTDRAAANHADLNLALRGYGPTSASLGLVNYDGGTDPSAPQLAGLFADRRSPVIRTVHRVNDWNWASNSRGNPISYPVVTLMEIAATAGETVHAPNSGYTLGSGYEVLVLYASAQRITLKYTRNDNVVHGYTLHIEGICVESSLLALYESWNAAGRGQLPALAAGQALGRSRGSAIGVAIRDNGSFLDPRSRKDWWRAY